MQRLLAHVLCRFCEFGIALSAIACACALARAFDF